MKFETFHLYTSDVKSPTAAALADFIRMSSGKPVRILTLDQMPVADPAERRQRVLSLELAALLQQRSGLQLLLDAGRDNPVRYAAELAGYQADKVLYDARIQELEQQLTQEGGEQQHG